MHILYVAYIIYGIRNKLEKREFFFQIVMNLPKFVQYIYWKKFCVSGPMQFKLMIFGG